MDLSKVSRALDSWMASVDPKNFIYTPEARVASSALFAATGVMETPAMMAVTGDQDVKAQQDALVQAQKAGPKSNEAVQKMLDAPMTGLMHVSDMARIASGWSPVSLQESEANSAAYQNYLNRMVSFPLVMLNRSERQTMSRTTKDWGPLLKSIADTFVGIAENDKEAIVGGLENLAKAASSSMSTVQKTSLFCQNAINAREGVYELFIYSSVCTFKEEKGKGFDMKQNTFDLLQVKLTLAMPLWIEDTVRKIIGKTESSLDDWLKQNQSSLEGTKSIPALTH